MTHPSIPTILELARPIAEALQLEIVDAVMHTNHRPPVLRIDIRNPAQDTGLEDCERMSRALESVFDEADILPDAYVLEISSPGLSSTLESDRDFISFRGFPVLVQTTPPYRGKAEWSGTLIDRDESNVRLNQRGRAIAIPREAITTVQLQDGA